MPKQTKLDEQAVIYQPRKEMTEKEKLKDMKFGEKLSYLWEYYKVHAAITIAVISLIIYFIYEIITPDIKPALYAAIINSAVDPTVLDDYSEELFEHLMLDPERETVELNDTYFLSTTGQNASMQQVLTTHIAAGEIDVIIAPESEFSNLTFYGYFAKLSDKLPTDVYSNLTDHFYLASTEDDATNNAYGIYLKDTDLFQNLTYNSEPYVMGIVQNYSHEDNTIEFIKYMFKNLKK